MTDSRIRGALALLALAAIGLLLWSPGSEDSNPAAPREPAAEGARKRYPQALRSGAGTSTDRVDLTHSPERPGERDRPSPPGGLLVHGVVAFESGEMVANARIEGQLLDESVEVLTAHDGSYRVEFQSGAGPMEGLLRLSSVEGTHLGIFPHEEHVVLSDRRLSLRIDLVASANWVRLVGSVVELQPPHEELDCPVTVVANGTRPVVSTPGSGFEIHAPVFDGSCSFEFWTGGEECVRRGACTVEIESPAREEAPPQVVRLYMAPSVTRDLQILGEDGQPIQGARALVPGGLREVGVSDSDGRMALCWDDERGFLALVAKDHAVMRLELGALHPGGDNTIRMKSVKPLQGWVRTTEGLPVPGALVSLSNTPSSAFGVSMVRANQEGEFAFFHRLSGGVHWLHVVGDPAVTVPVSPSQLDRVVELVVPTSGTITGIVSDESGHPIGGAIVSAVATDEGASLTAPSARANYDGTYTLDAIAGREYEVTHDAAGFRSEALRATSGDELSVVLRRSSRVTLDLSELLARGLQDFSLCAGGGAGQDFQPKTAWYYHSRVSSTLVVPLAFAEPSDEITVRVLVPHSGQAFDVPCLVQEAAFSSPIRVLWEHRTEGD